MGLATFFGEGVKTNQGTNKLNEISWLTWFNVTDWSRVETGKNKGWGNVYTELEVALYMTLKYEE